MALLARTAEVLQDKRQDFIPALAQPVGQATGWTLRDAMLVGLGLDRDAGCLAYFEYLELTAALAAADDELTQAGGLDRQAQRWANDRERTFDEVLELVTGAAASSTVEGPANPTLRPYCQTKLIRTCRVPFVPTVVLLLRWRQDQRLPARSRHHRRVQLVRHDGADRPARAGHGGLRGRG